MWEASRLPVSETRGYNAPVPRSGDERLDTTLFENTLLPEGVFFCVDKRFDAVPISDRIEEPEVEPEFTRS